MTIEQQLQKVIRETNILRDMISLFSTWDDEYIDWVLYNLDKNRDCLVMLQESIYERRKYGHKESRW